MRQMLARSFVVLCAGLMLLGVLASAAMAAPRGNSESAQACEESGYLNWTRNDVERTPFSGAGDCTSYAARGGTLVAVEPVDSRVVTLAWTWAAHHPAIEGTHLCHAFVSVSGFEGGNYTVAITANRDIGGAFTHDTSTYSLEVLPDGTGSVSTRGEYRLNDVWWNGYGDNSTYWQTATVDGVVSEPSAVSCEPPA